MVRTQIYLTESQLKDISAMAKREGKKQSEVIPEDIDRLLAKESASNRKVILNAAAGMWKDREDLPDFKALRGEWDRVCA